MRIKSYENNSVTGKLWYKNTSRKLTFLNRTKAIWTLLIGYNIMLMSKRNLEREYDNVKRILRY